MINEVVISKNSIWISHFFVDSSQQNQQRIVIPYMFQTNDIINIIIAEYKYVTVPIVTYYQTQFTTTKPGKYQPRYSLTNIQPAFQPPISGRG